VPHIPPGLIWIPQFNGTPTCKGAVLLNWICLHSINDSIYVVCKITLNVIRMNYVLQRL
jgi:hypothetical protein